MPGRDLRHHAAEFLVPEQAGGNDVGKDRVLAFQNRTGCLVAGGLYTQRKKWMMDDG